MWPLFIVLALLLGLALAFTSLLAALVGGLGSAWPVLLIALGVWLLWRHDGRHTRTSTVAPRAQGASVQTPA